MFKNVKWNASNNEVLLILKLFRSPRHEVSGRRIRIVAKKQGAWRNQLISDMVHDGILFPTGIRVLGKYVLTSYGAAIWSDMDRGGYLKKEE